MSQTSCEGKDKEMSPLVLLFNYPFKYLLGLPSKDNICLQLRSEIRQEGRWILTLCEMTIPLAPSKACLAAFTSYTRYFMIPLNSKLLNCFPAIWARTQQRSQGNPDFRAEPHLERSRPAAVAGNSLLSSHLLSELSAALWAERGKGLLWDAGFASQQAGRILCTSRSQIEDRMWPPGSFGISRQLPPRPEVRMLINTQMKGSCWVVINICH